MAAVDPHTIRGHVASVEKSLREVAPDPALTAYAVHDSKEDENRPVGFAVREVRDGVEVYLALPRADVVQ